LNQIPESRIRDYLAERIEHFPEMVQNLELSKNRLRLIKDEFFKIPSADGGPNSEHILRLLLAKRALKALQRLGEMELIDKEFPLLCTGRPGFQPAADILALSCENGSIFLLEVKKDAIAEREAATELGAYSSGLQHRCWGLCSSDYIWIPLCTEWRTTARNAFQHEIIWSNRSVLPMKMTITEKNATIESIALELLDLADHVDEPLASSQFAWDCFDTLLVCMKNELSMPQAFIDFIASHASNVGYSGFITYGKSILEGYLPYPYQFAICTHNPFKGALKRRQLEIILESEGQAAMRKQVRKRLWSGHDIDFRTLEDMWPGFVKENYPSLNHLIECSCSRTGPLWEEINERLRETNIDFELSLPDTIRYFEGDPSITPLFERIGYFGLFQEAIYERMLYEYHHKTEFGDGPVIGDLCGDPLSRIAHWDTLFKFMELMNFNHDCQVKYEDINYADASLGL